VNAPAVLMWILLDYFYGQIKKLGGKLHLTETKKTLYPYFFSGPKKTGLPAGWLNSPEAPGRFQILRAELQGSSASRFRSFRLAWLSFGP
jgi:hypothetical protein